MNSQQQAPTTQGTEQGQIGSIEIGGLRLHSQCKDTQISLSPIQNKVKKLLSDGGLHSTAEISATLHIADPRSAIRYLRGFDIPVSDVWVRGDYNSRYKRYFIHNAIEEGEGIHG